MNNITNDFSVIIFVFMYMWAPIITFLHEVGHALFALIFTKKDVSIRMGNDKKDGCKVKLRRLTIYLNKLTLHTGFCFWNELTLNKYKRALISLGGPIMSLIILVISVCIVLNSETPLIENIFGGAALYALTQFISTIRPTTYGYGSYAGYKSDGLRAIECIREE